MGYVILFIAILLNLKQISVYYQITFARIVKVL